MILGTVPVAFVGGILALLLAGETWNVSSLVGLIGLFGIAVQNSLVLVTQTRGLLAEGKPLPQAVREASIGRVRPKLMTAGTATLGLLPLLVLQLHGTEIERPLAIVMIGGLVTSTLFTLLVLPTFYLQVHGWLARRASRVAIGCRNGVMDGTRPLTRDRARYGQPRAPDRHHAGARGPVHVTCGIDASSAFRVNKRCCAPLYLKMPVSDQRTFGGLTQFAFTG